MNPAQLRPQVKNDEIFAYRRNVVSVRIRRLLRSGEFYRRTAVLNSARGCIDLVRSIHSGRLYSRPCRVENPMSHIAENLQPAASVLAIATLNTRYLALSPAQRIQA